MKCRVGLGRLRAAAGRIRGKLAHAGVHSLFCPLVGRHIYRVEQKALIVGVYRYANAPLLVRIAAEAKRHKWEVRFWALDQTHPLLESYSFGIGKGSKFNLLNRLIHGKNMSDFDWIVVVDDDIAFEYGSLNAFLALAARAGMAIAQPAHTASSFSSHPITICQPLAIARLTTFVEIGPVFAVNRAWHSRVLPFPEDNGMGWGLDVAWSDLQTEGARLGIIDWVPLLHLYPVARDYDTTEEESRLQESLRTRGFQSLRDLQKTVAVWHVWRSRPPWLSQSSD
jgi:hypothetical protein